MVKSPTVKLRNIACLTESFSELGTDITSQEQGKAATTTVTGIQIAGSGDSIIARAGGKEPTERGRELETAACHGFVISSKSTPYFPQLQTLIGFLLKA